MRRSLDALLAELHDALGDPRQGLPEPVFLFASAITPMINVDLLIQDDARRTLLTWRDDPFGAGWHIPGGVVRFKEMVEQRIHAVARLELGARVAFQRKPLALRQVFLSNRDARGHFFSLLYRCELKSRLDPAREFVSGRPSSGQWKWHATFPADMLRVHEMYKTFIEGKGGGDEPVAIELAL